MEVEIISREKIKPNAPTPHYLRIYKFTLLDQIIPSVYIPVVLYFSGGEQPIERRVQLLRDSLSSILTTYYPFAGVIIDSLSLHCNDDGLPFSVAKVNSRLTDFLRNPDIQFLNSLHPAEFTQAGFPSPGAKPVAIQLNCFDCGGIALSLTFAHILADLTSKSNFLKSWAENARGQTLAPPPLNCIAQSAFPQDAAIDEESHLYHSLQKFARRGKFVTRRYVIDESAISSLKEQTTSFPNDDDDDDGERPSRVEIATALIWKAFMEAAADKSSANRNPSLLTHSVNLRRRAQPSFPDNSFGNFLWLAPAVYNSINADMKGLVSEVKRAMRSIDAEFVENLQRDNGCRESLERLRRGIPGEANWFAVTSWSKLGLYGVDFGWGRPVWMSGYVCPDSDSDSVMPNGATLMDTRVGEGIEAWIIVEEKYVRAFENCEMIKKWTKINPPVV